jgi:hypothetical protein
VAQTKNEKYNCCLLQKHSEEQLQWEKGKIDEISQRHSYSIKRSTHNGTDALPVCHWACTQQQAIFHQLRSNNQANLRIFCSGADQQT